VVISLRDVGARRYLALAGALRRRARAALAPLGVKTHVTGTSLIAYRGINRLVTNLLESLAIALGLIGLVLILAFRSIKVGLVSLIPNVIPLATGLAFMAAAQIRLEPTTVMIYCIALGIAVDDTIHYVARYREECAAGRPPAEATRVTLLTTGRAMTVTSLVLVLGFAVVLVSNFPNTQRFGLLGCVILAAAWITDMLVTPACMLVFGVGRRRVGPTEEPSDRR
jgi:predicted RND superfamily exporter protein